MPFTAALSEHPSPPDAIGEVVGAVLDSLGLGSFEERDPYGNVLNLETTPNAPRDPPSSSAKK